MNKKLVINQAEHVFEEVTFIMCLCVCLCRLFGNRSCCYEKMLEYEKALTDADIALSMNPIWIKGLYRKGKALVGLKVLPQLFGSVIHHLVYRLTYNFPSDILFSHNLVVSPSVRDIMKPDLHIMKC